MTQEEAIKYFNEHLAGRYTSWDEFLVYAMAVVLIGVALFAIVSMFSYSKHDDDYVEDGYNRMKKILTYMLVSVGLLGVFFGAYLIFKI